MPQALSPLVPDTQRFPIWHSRLLRVDHGGGKIHTPENHHKLKSFGWRKRKEMHIGGGGGRVVGAEDGERGGKRERERERQRQTQTDREKEAEGETDGQTDSQTDRQTGRQAGRQASRQAGRQAGRQRDRVRETDRQTDRQKMNTVHSLLIALADIPAAILSSPAMIFQPSAQNALCDMKNTV